MVNYPGDVELEEDYELGWEWLETDPGPLIAPYSNFQQCLLDPTKTKPEDYFSVFFENWMYMILAEQTNLYARQQIEGKFTILSSQNTGNLLFFINLFFHIFSKIPCKICPSTVAIWWTVNVKRFWILNTKCTKF